MPRPTSVNSTTPATERIADEWQITSYQRWVHGRNLKNWLHAIDDYYASPGPRLNAAARKMVDCARYPMLYKSTDGTLIHGRCLCRHPLCPTCSRLAARKRIERIDALATHWRAPRTITLTLRSRDASLTSAIGVLNTCLSHLIRSKTWRDHVHQAIAVLEVTRNPSTRQWHPHYHIVYVGNYWPQPELLHTWTVIAREDTHVHIERVHAEKGMGSYLGRYLSSELLTINLDNPSLEEYLDAKINRRSFRTYGFSRTALRAAAPPERPKTEAILCSPLLIDAAARNGDARAAALLDQVADLPPTPSPADHSPARELARMAHRLCVLAIEDWLSVSTPSEKALRADIEIPLRAATQPSLWAGPTTDYAA